MDTFHSVLQGLSRTQHACSCCHSHCQRVVVGVAVAPWGQRAIQMVTAHMAPTWIPMCCVCLWPRDSTRHSPSLTTVPPPPFSPCSSLYLCILYFPLSIAQLCLVLFCLGAAGTCRVGVALWEEAGDASVLLPVKFHFHFFAALK